MNVRDSRVHYPPHWNAAPEPGAAGHPPQPQDTEPIWAPRVASI